MIRDRETLCRKLAEAHRRWLHDLSGRLAAVRSPDASTWERSTAVRYLEEEFVPRFRRESRAVSAVADRLSPAEANRVWVADELIRLLRIQLGQLLHVADSGVVFARLIGKLLRAFECWCGEVEALVAALPAEAVGSEPIGRFERFPDGADAAVSA
jgi:hypothetical protein